MEIERKFLTPCFSKGYGAHPSHQIEQTYLCMEPIVHIRQEDSSFYLTYKGRELLPRGEYNLPLTRKVYAHLPPKADGVVLIKKRRLIPLDGSDHLTIEPGVPEGRYAGLFLAEAEFTSGEEVMAFQAPEWFGRDVMFIRKYQDSRLVRGK